MFTTDETIKHTFVDAAPSPVAGTPMVYYGDMFEFCKKAAFSGDAVVLHNFANNEAPGLLRTNSDGSHSWLTHTQEEKLLRLTRKHRRAFLPLEMYPITTDEDRPSALYTKNVEFHEPVYCGLDTRHCCETDWVLARPKEHWMVDVITCAAEERPPLDGKRYTARSEERMLQRMKLVLRLARQNNKTLITGLWGAGAFQHPAAEVLRLWHRAAESVPGMFVICIMRDCLTDWPEENDGVWESYFSPGSGRRNILIPLLSQLPTHDGRLEEDLRRVQVRQAFNDFWEI